MTRPRSPYTLGGGWDALRSEVEASGARRRNPLRPSQDVVRPPRPGVAGPSKARPSAAVPGPSDPVDTTPLAPAAEHDGVPADAAPDVAQLVAAAKAGDAGAFGQLYDRYVDTVYRYAYYRVAKPADAEDITSETFVRALRRIDSFSWQGRDVAAWLITIARNLLADQYKSSRYRLEVPTEDMTSATRDQTAESPEALVLDALTNVTLLKAVQSLRADQQECIVLRFLQGMSVSETALIMDRNEGAIKALQYRAVRTLARRLPKESVA